MTDSEGGRSSEGKEPALSWDSPASQGWSGLMRSGVWLWSCTAWDVSVLCTYTYLQSWTCMHERVCTMYIHNFTFINRLYILHTFIYIHVHVHTRSRCNAFVCKWYKHVCTMFRHVCTVLPYPVQVGRIPDGDSCTGAHYIRFIKCWLAAPLPVPASARLHDWVLALACWRMQLQLVSFARLAVIELPRRWSVACSPAAPAPACDALLMANGRLNLKDLGFKSIRSEVQFRLGMHRAF